MGTFYESVTMIGWKCIEYAVEGEIPKGRSKKPGSEVADEKKCEAEQLSVCCSAMENIH